MRIKKIIVSAFTCSVMAAGYAFAQAPAQPEAVGGAEETVIANIPATSYWGVRGLSQTVAAEPLGAGRFNIAAAGSWFRQDQNIDNLDEGADVVLGRAALAWGVNSYVDLFALLPVSYTDSTSFALGEFVFGGQVSLPLPEESIFKIAAQFQLIWGLSKDKFTTLNDDYVYGEDEEAGFKYDSYAGYDFFDTRSNVNLAAKLAESFVFKYGQNQSRAFKVHLNEGFSFATDKTADWLFLAAAGLEWDPIECLTVGAELNWRTPFKDVRFSNPFWITPSIMYRSPWLFGILGGVDVNLSPKHNDNLKPLEPFRVFGDVVISFDFLAEKRAAAARRAREEAAEKARLEAEAQRLAAEKDGLAQKAVEDSIRAAEEMAKRAEADSLRAKAVADSLANLMNNMSQQAQEREAQLLAEAAAKRKTDSLARADLEKKLSEERAKRSEAEQMMLSTGMLVLDGVYFVTGKADIQLNSRGYLTTIARMLVKYPKLRLEIGGHTDATGRFETNMALSQSRAQAVFSFLVNLDPALSQMLTVRGYGPTVPKADNATAAGREINRRVELKVLNPEVLKDYNP